MTYYSSQSFVLIDKPILLKGRQAKSNFFCFHIENNNYNFEQTLWEQILLSFGLPLKVENFKTLDGDRNYIILTNT